MSWDEKIACGINMVVGAIAGAVVFIGALGRFEFLAGKSTAWWNGWAGMILCVTLGGIAGAASYFRRHREFDLPAAGIYEGSGGTDLLLKRIGVIIGAIVAIYFLWQLAKSI